MNDINKCRANNGRWDNLKKKCYIPSKKNPSKIQFNGKTLFITILLIVGLGLISIIMTNLGTMVHEFAGHTVVAKILGCETTWDVDTYTGTTTFDNCMLQDNTDKVCNVNADCNDDNTATNDRCLDSKCTHENKGVNILIAFGSIVAVFFLALALWIFINKDSPIRVFAIIIMFYSCIPSAFPLMPGSDMAYAVGQGFPIWLAWTIYLMIAGIFLWLLTNEVTDKAYFRGLLK